MLVFIHGTDVAADRLALSKRQVLVNSREIESVDDRQNRFDHPADVAVLVFLKVTQEADQFLNEPKRPWNILLGVVQRDRLRIRIEPCEEQAVGQHLCECIGEFLQGQFMEYLIAKNLV